MILYFCSSFAKLMQAIKHFLPFVKRHAVNSSNSHFDGVKRANREKG
jgi:hypothetical protein